MELFDPYYQAGNASGLPLSGAKLAFYRAGTSALVTVYQDAGGATPHTNPVTADAAGLFPPIYLSTTYPLKTILKTALGVTIQTVQRINPAPVGIDAGMYVVGTLAALTAITPSTEFDEGQVLADATASNNGYYYRSASAWVKGRGFPDTLAKLTVTGGTANAVQASTASAVDPANIVAFYIDIATPNTGNVTISINGETAIPAYNINGDQFAAGEWDGRLFLSNETASLKALTDAAAAASAAASAAAAQASQAASEDFASAAAASAAGVDLPPILLGDARKQLFVKDDETGYRLDAAARGGEMFKTVALLLADNNAVVGYAGSGAEVEVAAGDIIVAQGFRYEVAASGATDADVTTAGGVKLYVLRNADGTVTPEQFGGTTHTHIQAAIDFGPGVISLSPVAYSIGAAIRLKSYRVLRGAGYETDLVWSGGDNATVLEVFADATGSTALAAVGLENFKISTASAANVIGVEWIYASVQSYARDIFMQMNGVGVTGLYISKTWYARFDTISVRSTTKQAGARGFHLSAEQGQVNAIAIINPQTSVIETGIDLDTQGGYIYALTVIGGTIENGTQGVKHTTGDTGQGVRQAAFVGTYFENNSSYDINWTTDALRNDTTQQVSWIGCQFYATGNNLINEGFHYFRGCDRLTNLEVNNNNTFAYVDGVNATNLTGTATANVRVQTRPTDTNTGNFYSHLRAKPGAGQSVQQTISGASTTTDVAIPSGLYTSTANGETLRVTVTSRRAYDSLARHAICFLTRNASGTWGLDYVAGTAIDATWGVTALTAGVRVTDTRGDTRWVTVLFEPM